MANFFTLIRKKLLLPRKFNWPEYSLLITFVVILVNEGPCQFACFNISLCDVLGISHGEQQQLRQEMNAEIAHRDEVMNAENEQMAKKVRNFAHFA